MSSQHHNPWTTLSERTAYDNPWISVSHREVLTPAGTDGIYGVVHFKNYAIGILPIDVEGNTYLVGQYRYTLGRYSWEIPEGGCPKDEQPIEAAQRELLEETGLTATDWTILGELDTTNSVTDETGYMYLATGLTQGQAQPEDTEDLQTRKLPFRELYEMCLNGRITDALTLVTVLKAAALAREGRVSIPGFS